MIAQGKKKKILIIINGLQKAGEEKYAYELARNIDKNKFEVEVLTKSSVNNDNEFPHYYFSLLKENSIKIHTFLDNEYHSAEGKDIINKSFIQFKNLYKRFIRKIKLRKLFNSQDAIILINAVHFYLVKSHLPDNVHFETHLMCHQVQFDYDVYKDYDREKKYNFVYIDFFQLDEIQNAGVKIERSFPFSLSIENKNILDSKINIQTKFNRCFNIGVFTRICRTKPIEKSIKAFSILLSRNRQCKLFIVGYHQDLEYLQVLKKLIDDLGISNSVIFTGHSNDMKETIQEYNIDIIWILSIFGFSGYAGVELMSKGIPCILNNVEEGNNHINPNNGKARPPYFYDENKLVDFTEIFINNEKGLNQLAEDNLKVIKSKHSLEDNISNYENYILDILK